MGKLRSAALALLPAAFAPAAVHADDQKADQPVAVHQQATFTVQRVFPFHALYSGPNSLTPRGETRETFDTTLGLGVRPWTGAELWADPEIDQGFGVGNTLGVAGFPSGEAYKVGKAEPYFRLQRLFLRQTIGLGGGSEKVDADMNQLAGARDSDRLILTLGKLSVVDIFDTNKFAHDPRADFLNWAIVDAGTFDYAADAWGYSIGGAAELTAGNWTARAGLFNLSKIPNGETLETGFQQFQSDFEIEYRHKIGGQEGAVRATFFRNRGRFASYADALALARQTGAAPTLLPVRKRRSRAGFDVNFEQALTSSLGIFGRAGWADGSIEPYDFTDIDRTASAGASLKGDGWKRKDDRIGLALLVNGISAIHRRYLAAGGLGVLIGDGRLDRYGPEEIGELYYDLSARPFHLSLDYQFVRHPAYNRDRGPAHLLALRLHESF
ncbi:MAG TPA: carbohydrate porin [Allosphingosinicella sp.]|nr:carbohydrate porin [Allosphingosinicella sp.]